jgi:4-hydroxyproline epimerase
MQPIDVIDSHTAGEPTRVVIRGGPPLGVGTVADRCDRFRSDFDRFRTAVVTEPRGSDVLVGALLCEPSVPDHLIGVIFFNNVGFLGMCGHGMIGVVESLRYLGRIGEGEHKIETPVGTVTVNLNRDGSVSVRNVVSYRLASELEVHVEGIGRVCGDVAWGGNWFFLTRQCGEPLRAERVGQLQRIAAAIRLAVNEAGFPQVDHVELFGDPVDGESDSRNFVLCPGMEYDRSPCGTGTSAKLACLAAEGELAPGQPWIQEGILGTKFRAHYRWSDELEQAIEPTITGSAFVTAEAKLMLDQRDPFRWGLCGQPNAESSSDGFKADP